MYHCENTVIHSVICPHSRICHTLVWQILEWGQMWSLVNGVPLRWFHLQAAFQRQGMFICCWGALRRLSPWHRADTQWGGNETCSRRGTAPRAPHSVDWLITHRHLQQVAAEFRWLASPAGATRSVPRDSCILCVFSRITFGFHMEHADCRIRC